MALRKKFRAQNVCLFRCYMPIITIDAVFFESNENNARKWSNLANHHNIVHVMYIIIRRFSNSIRPALILSFILSLATITIFKADSKQDTRDFFDAM